MSRLRSIARQLHIGEQPPAPPPTAASGLGEALEALIDQQVEQRVSEALARHRERLTPVPRIDPATFAQQPKPALAPPAREVQFIRDELGRVAVVTIGDLKFTVQRDGMERAVGMLPADDSRPPSPPPSRHEQIVEDYERSRDA